jgi:hypothetical protein
MKCASEMLSHYDGSQSSRVDDKIHYTIGVKNLAEDICWCGPNQSLLRLRPIIPEFAKVEMSPITY